MSLLPILHFPDPRLRKQAKTVSTVDDSIRQLVDDMLETMYESKGIGLAATQVNVQKRVVVMDLSEQRDQPMVFINPVITPLNGKQTYDEGCLSVPGFYETIERDDKIKVDFLDKNGDPQTLEADGLLSVCLQHELDHLEGKLFVDYLSTFKRQRIKEKMRKQLKKLSQ
ncbi:MAG: peptide deformylase [Pseudomonadota bacterium]|nr:peptide deformylase [Pseudomonadota bacterium]